MQAGAAREGTVTLARLPGETEFTIVSMTGGEEASLEAARWAGMFDLSLAGVGDRYAGPGNFVDVARYGHFTDAGLPWERVGSDDPGCHSVVRESSRSTTDQRRTS